MMTITVVYDSRKIEMDQIRKSISKPGYAADDTKANPAGLAKADDCCKK